MKIPTRLHGWVDIEAFPTATPGLVVHRSVEDDATESSWVVAHERSGLRLTELQGNEWAVALAAALGGLCDWTASGVEVRSSIDKQAFTAIVAEFDGVRLTSRPHLLEDEALSR